jgi:hypothetical protein
MSGSPSSTIYQNIIDLQQYGTLIVAKHLDILLTFDGGPFVLTEVKFDNELSSKLIFDKTLDNETTTKCTKGL